MQRVTRGIGDAFGLPEKALRETFLPALFEGLGEGAPEREGTRERSHPPTSETSETGPSVPNADSP